MKRIAVLLSGRGSNFEALLAASCMPGFPGEIVVVGSNRADAKGLETARAAAIPTFCVLHREYQQRSDFDAALIEALDAHRPDLVVLAGFMRILTPAFVDHFAGRLMNIHPSLLPSFPGLHTHERALAEGVRIHGCTVHFVTADLDHGPVVVQAAVPVLPEDDAQALAARVLSLEHRIYPQAVRWFCEDRLRLDHGRVSVDAERRASTPELIVPFGS